MTQQDNKAEEYNLAAFYRFRDYTIVVEPLNLFDYKYEGIAYKISHYNPQFVVRGNSWKCLCQELEGLINET